MTMQWFTNVRRGGRNRYQWSLLPVADALMSGKMKKTVQEERQEKMQPPVQK